MTIRINEEPEDLKHISDLIISSSRHRQWIARYNLSSTMLYVVRFSAIAGARVLLEGRYRSISSHTSYGMRSIAVVVILLRSGESMRSRGQAPMIDGNLCVYHALLFTQRTESTFIPNEALPNVLQLVRRLTSREAFL